MRLVGLCSIFLLVVAPAVSTAEEAVGVGPLRTLPLERVGSLLPRDTHVLIERTAIERFLDDLEGAPPDWAAVYGHGHHDPGHDDRLFELNRTRDAKRDGKPALHWRIAFVWPGELSTYDSEVDGFSVVIGPKFNHTRWGVVRFKYEDVPGNLRAIPDRTLGARLRRRAAQQKKVEIFVVMSGRLIPEESIVYDFSHDREGLGLIMPVVRVDRIEYLLAR
jgi:hypothetical protein